MNDTTCISQNNGRTEEPWFCAITSNFRRKLSSVYRQKTCLFIEELTPCLLKRTHLLNLRKLSCLWKLGIRYLKVDCEF